MIPCHRHCHPFAAAVTVLSAAVGPSELKAGLQLHLRLWDVHSQHSSHGSGSVADTSQEAECAWSLRNPGHRFELQLLIATSRLPGEDELKTTVCASL